jgi:hypothetical protein
MPQLDYVAVTCEGCRLVWLGGMGGKDDPCNDATYSPTAKVWVCAECYCNFAVEDFKNKNNYGDGI